MGTTTKSSRMPRNTYRILEQKRRRSAAFDISRAAAFPYSAAIDFKTPDIIQKPRARKQNLEKTPAESTGTLILGGEIVVRVDWPTPLISIIIGAPAHTWTNP